MITVQRALWLIRLGTFPSRNSLRPAMPAFPTTSTSISAASAACTIAIAGSSSITTCDAAAVAGDPLGLRLQVLGGRRGPGALGRAELGVGRARGDHHLDEVQLGAVALGERGRPADRLRGGLRPVGPHHDAADRRRSRASITMGA